jgi:hypothetical protein
MDTGRHFRTRNQGFQANYKITADIERFGGQTPKSLRNFLAEWAHVFMIGGVAAQ